MAVFQASRYLLTTNCFEGHYIATLYDFLCREEKLRLIIAHYYRTARDISMPSFANLTL